jgi:hypothetical protein
MGSSDADRQLELWKTWKSDPTEDNLEPLLKEFEPDVDWRVSEFSRSKNFPVPEASLRSKGRMLALKGLQTYNPEKPGSAGVRTWVNWQLKKLRSFAVENQNFGRIPEQRALQIGNFKQVRDDLTERMGMPPDAITLSEALQTHNPKYSWSVAEVNRMQTELRADRIESMSLDPDALPSLFESGERDILRYIYHDLTSQERLVYEYTLGINGKPKLPAKDIANRMMISGPKVSRLRTSIDNKMRKRGLE